MLSNDLLLHGLSHTTIGAVAFHFRVRDGNGWDHNAIVTEQAGEASHSTWEVGMRLLAGGGEVTRCLDFLSMFREGCSVKSWRFYELES
jgi:hypothetical protein